MSGSDPIPRIEQNASEGAMARSSAFAMLQLPSQVWTTKEMVQCQRKLMNEDSLYEGTDVRVKSLWPLLIALVDNLFRQ